MQIYNMQIAGASSPPFSHVGLRGRKNNMFSSLREGNMDTALAFVALYTLATASLLVLLTVKGLTVYEKGG